MSYSQSDAWAASGRRFNVFGPQDTTGYICLQVDCPCKQNPSHWGPRLVNPNLTCQWSIEAVQATYAYLV